MPPYSGHDFVSDMHAHSARSDCNCFGVSAVCSAKALINAFSCTPPDGTRGSLLMRTDASAILHL
jgi:hypothetical protein